MNENIHGAKIKIVTQKFTSQIRHHIHQCEDGALLNVMYQKGKCDAFSAMIPNGTSGEYSISRIEMFNDNSIRTIPLA